MRYKVFVKRPACSVDKEYDGDDLYKALLTYAQHKTMAWRPGEEVILLDGSDDIIRHKVPVIDFHEE